MHSLYRVGAGRASRECLLVGGAWKRERIPE